MRKLCLQSGKVVLKSFKICCCRLGPRKRAQWYLLQTVTSLFSKLIRVSLVLLILPRLIVLWPNLTVV